ncbi:hypothetical protein ACFYWP_40260 [Actinacidiphila glaucinigra]|uniref:hypothetical protein n=1 Tax=Actinacidiphila glaucinigra TaxID=235986 RepID=UPI0036C247FE
MVSAAHTTEDLQVTAGALQGELQRLESQKQALERELAAVVAHLGSVRRALGALSHLALTGPAVAAAGIDGADVRTEERQSPVVEDGAADDTGHPDEDGGEEAIGAQAAASAMGGYGRLTEQILEYLATTGGSEVRAREVAAALGRDENAGSINAVRSTLDRLVGASRVQRAGRGLYRAAV